MIFDLLTINMSIYFNILQSQGSKLEGRYFTFLTVFFPQIVASLIKMMKMFSCLVLIAHFQVCLIELTMLIKKK